MNRWSMDCVKRYRRANHLAMNINSAKTKPKPPWLGPGPDYNTKSIIWARRLEYAFSIIRANLGRTSKLQIVQGFTGLGPWGAASTVPQPTSTQLKTMQTMQGFIGLGPWGAASIVPQPTSTQFKTMQIMRGFIGLGRWSVVYEDRWGWNLKYNWKATGQSLSNCNFKFNGVGGWYE